jgi:hypothetical protein
MVFTPFQGYRLGPAEAGWQLMVVNMMAPPKGGRGFEFPSARPSEPRFKCTCVCAVFRKSFFSCDRGGPMAALF